MMPRKQNEVEKSLQLKGFARSKGDHNYFHYYSKAGKKSGIFTKTSHGAREIHDPLLSQMAKQCKLSNSDFSLLIDCPLDRDSYELKLVELGFVEPTR
jgi:predicted RNA binding protein YcfA (HicA-like mRNA interferase family)